MKYDQFMRLYERDYVELEMNQYVELLVPMTALLNVATKG